MMSTSDCRTAANRIRVIQSQAESAAYVSAFSKDKDTMPTQFGTYAVDVLSH